MTIRSKMFAAAAAIALSAGAFAAPAYAVDSDYGQYRYTSEDPTRFAPAGIPSEEAGATEAPQTNFVEPGDNQFNNDY